MHFRLLRRLGIHVYLFRNDSTHRLAVAHLPIRQTLIWLGPIFILFQKGVAR